MMRFRSIILIFLFFPGVAQSSQALQDVPVYFRYSRGGCDGLCPKFTLEFSGQSFLVLKSQTPIEGKTEWEIPVSAAHVRAITKHVESTPVLHTATVDCSGVGLGEYVTILVYRSDHLNFSKHIDFNCRISPESSFKAALKTFEDLLPIWDLIGEMRQ